MTKPSWYDYRYCIFCGTELTRIERPSTVSFNPYTGKPNTFIQYRCPNWGGKSSWSTSHFNKDGVYEDTREEPV